MENVTARGWLFLSAVLMFAASTTITSPAYADKRIFSSPLDNPADLAEGQAILRSDFARDNPHLNAHIYNPEKPPVHTIEDYVRVYIRVGRGDLDDDGVEE